MRISTRNPDDTNPKCVLVPDLGAAQYLQGLFPGSTIELLETEIPTTTLIKNGGRPRKHASNAARVSHQRKTAREKRLHDLRQLVRRIGSQDHSKNGDMNGHAENPIDIISSIGTGVSHGSLFINKYHSLPFGFICGGDNDRLVEALHDIWSGEILFKEDNYLISPSVFDPALSPDTKRGLENIVYCRHVWLDFENGDLRPEEFPRVFPNLKMVVTNTFHHRDEHPRFRVMIPTTNILTREAYVILQGQITGKLQEAGYSVGGKAKAGANTRRSGLDTGKQAPSSLFYLPCQAMGSNEGFFRYYNDEGREFLDAARWIENGLIPLAPEPVEWVQPNTDEPIPVRQDAVNAAIGRWQSTPNEEGHAAFFQLAVDLRSAGMGEVDIRMTLRAQASFGHTPKQRQAEITGIIKDLKRKSRIALKA